jgi:hypothetical protein
MQHNSKYAVVLYCFVLELIKIRTKVKHKYKKRGVMIMQHNCKEEFIFDKFRRI